MSGIVVSWLPMNVMRLCWLIRKKRTCRFIGFTIPVDHKVKIKERENLKKY